MITADLIGAFLAYAIFFSVRQRILDEPITPLHSKQVLSALGVAVFWLCLYWMYGMYQGPERRSRLKEIQNLGASSFVGSLIIFFILLLDDVGVKTYTQYYQTLGWLLFLHFSVSSFFRLSALTWIKHLVRKGDIYFTTLIIGCGARARDLLDQLDINHGDLGHKIVGYIKVDTENCSLNGNLAYLGSIKDLEGAIQEIQPEDAIIALDEKDHHLLEEIIGRLDNFSINTSISADLYEILIGSVRVQHIFGAPLIEIKKKLVPVWIQVYKRIFDILASTLVLVIGFPFFLIFSLITLFSSKGPIFFLQERIGQKGKPFNIIKFRSMVMDAEKHGPQLSSRDDQRITPWGRIMRRTRIDELPQFFNVIMGDMSIVGPRPERQFFINKIMEEAPYYRHLQKIRPGITSLGQVKLGYAENLDQMVERLKYDVIYLENISPGLDLRILFLTIFIILQGRGK